MPPWDDHYKRMPPCHSTCGTLKNPHCSMAEPSKVKMWSPSPAMVMSPYEWKISRVRWKTLNKQRNKQTKYIPRKRLWFDYLPLTINIYLIEIKVVDIHEQKDRREYTISKSIDFFYCREVYLYKTWKMYVKTYCSYRVTMKMFLRTKWKGQTDGKTDGRTMWLL